MRKKYLLVLPLLALLGVSSCGDDNPPDNPGGDNPGGEEPGYSIVTYDYNYDGASDQKFVVNEGQNLNLMKLVQLPLMDLVKL